MRFHAGRPWWPVVVWLSISGCASTGTLRWTPANGEPATRAPVDIQECRSLARDEAWRRSWEGRWPPHFYDPLYMPPYYRARDPFWLSHAASLEREQALFEFCMHSKGYRLTRVAE